MNSGQADFLRALHGTEIKGSGVGVRDKTGPGCLCMSRRFIFPTEILKVEGSVGQVGKQGQVGANGRLLCSALGILCLKHRNVPGVQANAKFQSEKLNRLKTRQFLDP